MFLIQLSQTVTYTGRWTRQHVIDTLSEHGHLPDTHADLNDTELAKLLTDRLAEDCTVSEAVLEVIEKHGHVDNESWRCTTM